MKYLGRGFLWMLAFLLLTLAPLFALLVEPVPDGRDFITDFSVALGFVGLAMMGLQFILTARVQFITLPFGIDVVYHFHRQISIMAFLFILVHPILLFINDPELLSLLNPIEAPWRARFGLLALILMFVIVATSIWRIRLGLNYERWRLLHSSLAVIIIILSMLHVIGVGYYVSSPWKQALWIGLGVFWVSILVYTRLLKPFLLLRHPYIVEEVIEERDNCWTLVVRAYGHDGMTFKAGQFAWLSIWNTPFSIREHPFSFSSSAANTDTYQFTIKELGDFTETIEDVPVGKRIYVDGPYGAFSTERYDASAYVFLAGGIGVTPVMSIIRTLRDRGDTRPLTLLYGNPNWEDVTFREELDDLQNELNLKVVHVLEEAPDDWDGETGFIDEGVLERNLPEDHDGIEYFICGPEPMLEPVEAALERHGIPPERIHTERYSLN